jgi:hypothetical protein
MEAFVGERVPGSRRGRGRPGQTVHPQGVVRGDASSWRLAGERLRDGHPRGRRETEGEQHERRPVAYHERPLPFTRHLNRMAYTRAGYHEHQVTVRRGKALFARVISLTERRSGSAYP